MTHVLLDSWYSAKCLWRAVRERKFLITSGLNDERWLQIDGPSDPRGWRWQRLTDETAQLDAREYSQLTLPKGQGKVYVHVVTTRVRKFYRCDTPHGLEDQRLLLALLRSRLFEWM